MPDLIVTDLSGQSELLTDYKISSRKRVVNGEYSLPFLIYKTARNEHAFDLVQEESIVEYDGQQYRIKKIREYTIGQTCVKDAQIVNHVFFDIRDDYQYDVLSGTLNITQALNHVFGVTDWTWVNHGAFNSVEFDKFGDGTALALFQTILDRYGAEFEITGDKEITLKNQIGEPRDAQFRYRHNIKTLNKDIDSSNVSTYIKGFGKQNEDGTYAASAEYTSPNVSIYGIRHAPPVRDDRFTDNASLLDYITKSIQDTPAITIEIEIVELLNQGIPIYDYDLGDTIYLIHEDLGIDATVRILEYTDYPGTNKSPTVVLSNFKNSMAKILSSFAQTSKTLKQLTDSDGNLSLALKRLYRNSDHYSDNTGDWYISPDDPNAMVHIGAGGIDVHKGLIRVEREDGYAVIVGGVLQNSLTIQGSEPPFQGGNIEKSGQYYRNQYDVRTDNIQRFVFKHDSRYVRVICNMYCDGGADYGNVGNIAFDVIWEGLENMPGGDITSVIITESRWHEDQGYRKEVLIDLGVPTGNLIVMYWRMWSSVAGFYTYGNIRYLVQEG